MTRKIRRICTYCGAVIKIAHGDVCICPACWDAIDQQESGK